MMRDIRKISDTLVEAGASDLLENDFANNSRTGSRGAAVMQKLEAMADEIYETAQAQGGVYPAWLMQPDIGQRSWWGRAW
jgi:hypothetical protein